MLTTLLIIALVAAVSFGLGVIKGKMSQEKELALMNETYEKKQQIVDQQGATIEKQRLLIDGMLNDKFDMLEEHLANLEEHSEVTEQLYALQQQHERTLASLN